MTQGGEMFSLCIHTDTRNNKSGKPAEECYAKIAFYDQICERRHREL